VHQHERFTPGEHRRLRQRHTLQQHPAAELPRQYLVQSLDLRSRGGHLRQLRLSQRARILHLAFAEELQLSRLDLELRPGRRIHHRHGLEQQALHAALIFEGINPDAVPRAKPNLRLGRA
jgi:hypothetical protein